MKKTSKDRARAKKNKKQTACNESFYNLLDTSSINDWKWSVGGFPCRDCEKERIFGYLKKPQTIKTE